jgi:hypothetical protein
MDVLTTHAAMGAAAQSGLRLSDKLRAVAEKSVQVETPPLVVVSPADLGVVEEVQVSGRAAHSISLVEQALAASGVRRAQVVEAYELGE